eukprot:5967086-Alexandrium_andersonii.AAC.1
MTHWSTRAAEAYARRAVATHGFETVEGQARCFSRHGPRTPLGHLGVLVAAAAVCCLAATPQANRSQDAFLTEWSRRLQLW